MIDELHVRNVALIREAGIAPAEGLTVITGETGSGKTALLEGLKLLVGERGQATAVRDGAEALRVEGRIFAEGGGEGDAAGCPEEGHVVVRTLTARGRGRVTIDGAMATVAELAHGIGRTVDLCGQHEHQRLLSPAGQLAFLDGWAAREVGPALDAWRGALAERASAGRALREARELSHAADERLDDAAFTLRRIDEVDPKPGELDALREALFAAEHADELLRAVEGAREAIAGDEGASDLVAQAADALRSLRTSDQTLASAVDELEEAAISLEDVAQTLRRYAEGVELDPERLEEMRERHAALQGLVRSYGPSLDDVLAKREEAARLLEAARDGAGAERRARERVSAAEAELAKAADALDAAREEAGERLCALVTSQLGRLGMAGAETLFSARRLPRESWGPGGPSSTELLYRSAGALSPRPLARVASGGEISRVMLAMKVVQGASDEAETLVFDEVDAGVGGQAARQLAEVIVDLAKTRQVICVTHLPQVAVAAERHYVVSKEAGSVDGIPETRVAEVEGEARVAEIARMLAGTETEASRTHARELLGL